MGPGSFKNPEYSGECFLKKPPRLSPFEKPLRWVVGLHASKEALKVHPHWVRGIALEEGRNLPSINSLAEKNGLSVKRKNKKFFNSLAQDHQGVALALNNRPCFQETVTHRKKKSCGFSRRDHRSPQPGSHIEKCLAFKGGWAFYPKKPESGSDPHSL